MRYVLVVASLVWATACARGERAPEAPAQAANRDCDCPCAAATVTAPPPVPVASQPEAPTNAGAAESLLSSASRKMNHGDGLGCLRDLDQLLAADPNSKDSQVMLRAQCEMLSGRCQAGKQRIDAWLAYQMNTPPEQRRRSVETLASLYCRGGDMTDRDRLLTAHQQLMQGAYVSRLSVGECQSAYRTTRSLMKKVPPRDTDDTVVAAIPRSLFHTAANCFARAGDCSAARRAFDESYPQATLASVKDPTLRQRVLDETFASVVPKCVP